MVVVEADLEITMVQAREVLEVVAVLVAISQLVALELLVKEIMVEQIQDQAPDTVVVEAAVQVLLD
jgi:hypothetical protein